MIKTILSHVPESKQIDFEEQFKLHINRMFVDKEQYITKL